MKVLHWIREVIFGPNGVDVPAQDEEVHRLKEASKIHMDQAQTNIRIASEDFDHVGEHP